MKQQLARGLEHLRATTAVLQRARLADAGGGIWEAADLHWWWRTPRASDDIDKPVWIDEVGPVAAVALTEWPGRWQCDPLVVPGSSSVDVGEVWSRALRAVDDLGLPVVEVEVREDDDVLPALLADAGFTPTGARTGVAWMPAPAPSPDELPDGFHLVDRASPNGGPHPMRRRNGEHVEARLRQSWLYAPSLDLAVETAEGDVAGYALFWFDPVTRVGMLEPMRTEEEYQRRGLARALIAAGVDRLARRGAERVKVAFMAEGARDLYVGSGFEVIEATGTYRRQRR